MAFNQTSTSKTSTFGKGSTQTGARLGNATTGGNTSGIGGNSVKKKALFRTGLFSPDKEGVKSVGSAQVKEEITIPAGSYINLYVVDDPTMYKGNPPAFNLTVTEGQLKAAT